MEIKQVSFLGSQPEYQEYSAKDVSLIQQKTISPAFTLFSNDYVEYFIYDTANTLLASNYIAHSYTPVNPNSVDQSTNTLMIDPEQDITRYGIDRGSVNISYNFYTKLFDSDNTKRFWISDISEDRTELRVLRNDISNTQLQTEFTAYQQTVFALPYYPDFLLNFGENKSIIGVNLLFASSSQQASLLIKLYEPLPDEFDIKSTFWMVQKLAEPLAYNVTITVPPSEPTSSYKLKGPNFDIEIKKTVGQTTDLYNYNTLYGIGTGSLASTSSLNQIKSLLQEKSIDINVDYSEFSNFVHFSSALERLYNFKYKMELIEDFEAKIAASGSITGSGTVAQSSLINFQKNVDGIIEKFDEYEYYLYYTSASAAWPKYSSASILVSGSDPIITNLPYSVTSSQVIDWLGNPINTYTTSSGILGRASVYDSNNPDYLINTLPQYIRDDAENNPAFLFVSMLGQHFDNLYVYYKDITTRFAADNAVNVGISKDLVANALQDLGINLYTNSSIADNVYYSLLGISPQGNTLGNYFPAGNAGVGGSIGSITYPLGINLGTSAEDIQVELYKRIYHNLPYLLKTKGTERGLRALISCFGIPDSILKINEFGGVGEDTSLGAFTSYDAYSGLITSASTIPLIVAPWGPVGYDYLLSQSLKVPDTVNFRFNAYNGHPTASHNGTSWGDTFYSHSTALFYVNTGSAMQFGVQLEYISTTASQYSPLASLGITGSAVSGSPYENYGYMSLWLSGSNGYATTSRMYLPFYDPSLWWNVFVYRETSSLINESSSANRYWIHAEADLYDAEGIATRGFVGSSSIYVSTLSSSYNAAWNFNNSSSLGSASIVGSSSVTNPVISSVNSYIGGYTASYNGTYYLSTSLTITASYLSGGIIPSNSYAIGYVSASVSASGFIGTFTTTSLIISRSVGGLFAGYIGGNLYNSSMGSGVYDGMYHEFRYWRTALSSNARTQQVFNASSIVGNGATSSLYDCIFRLDLTTDLSTGSSYFSQDYNSLGYVDPDSAGLNASIRSIHPAVLGSFNLLGQNYDSVPSFYYFSSPSSSQVVNVAAYSASTAIGQYQDFFKYDLVSTGRTGLTQRVNKKVSVPNVIEFTGSVLSPFTSIQKVDDTITRNSPNVEVVFSVSDQLDDDIAAQMGTFDIDNYIGAPADLYNDTYTELSTLRDVYFSKYIGANNLYDLTRAISFYDNSLFKMIKDFVPAKARLTTGISVKPHVLERSKYKRNEPTLTFAQYSASLGDNITHISGSWGLGTNPEKLKNPSFVNYVTVDNYVGGYTASYNGTYYLSSSWPTTASYLSGTLLPSNSYAIQFYSASVTQSGFYGFSSSLVNTTYYKETINGLTGSVTVEYTDNAALFTGRFGGTLITQSNVFPQYETSNLSNTTVALGDYSYPTTSFNYLRHNISGSRKSVTLLDLDYSYRADVPVNLDLIEDYYLTQSVGNRGVSPYWPFAQIQDSDYNLFSHNSSRYLGSKVSSSLINTYSIADDTISKIDKPYGKVAALDSYVRKIGLFTQVVTSSFFSNRNNVSMIYLVDESGSFLELNKDNKNWEEFQNTFTLGGNTTIKLFDNQKYSDQKQTEGSKVIYSSGYSYYPMLYFNRDSDRSLYFAATNQVTPKVFSAEVVSGSFITGSTSNRYPLVTSGSKRTIYNMFDIVTYNQGDYFTTGSAAAYANYTVPENGTYAFTSSFTINTATKVSNASASYTFKIERVSPSYLELGSQTEIMNNASQSLQLSLNRAYVASDRTGDGLQAYVHGPITQDIKIKNTLGAIIGNIPNGSYLYIATGSRLICNGAPSYTMGRDLHIIYATASTATAFLTGSITGTNITGSTYFSKNLKACQPVISNNFRYLNNPLIWEYGGAIAGGGPFTSNLETGNSNLTLNFEVATGNTSLAAGDIIRFKLDEDYSSTSDYTASFANAGTLGVAQTSTVGGVYPSAISTVSNNFISGTAGLDTFILNTSLSNLYQYQFLPNFITGSSTSSSLYAGYGDVDFAFNLSFGDVMIIKQGSYYQEFDIINVDTLGNGALSVQVQPLINDTFLDVTLIETASFLTKKKDESNMILAFPKKDGKTSYGLVIPNNLAPDVLQNIDTINKEIQSKLGTQL